MAMTVAELMDILGKRPPGQKVLQAKDAEGNDFSPLAAISEGMYDAVTTYSGDVYPTPEEVADPNTTYGPDDIAPEEAERVLIMWPTN